MNLRRHLHEPAWCDLRVPTSATPPLALRSWLVDGSSLTRRLQAHCPHALRVEIVAEGRERPRLSEADLLAISPDRLAWVREVFLCCGTQRWVFARTVIPMDTFRGPNRGLAHLGSQPLGAFLFAHPRLRRGPLQVAKVPERGGAGAFGRRSLFFLRGRPLLVSEFFLPDFVDSLKQ